MLQLVFWGPVLFPQKVIYGGTVSAQRIIWRHEPAKTQPEAGALFLFSPLIHQTLYEYMLSVYGDLKLPSALLVVNKAVHEQPFFYELFPLRILGLQVPVVVIGHNDAIGVEG